jgi:hypothetical protein
MRSCDLLGTHGTLQVRASSSRRHPRETFGLTCGRKVSSVQEVDGTLRLEPATACCKRIVLIVVHELLSFLFCHGAECLQFLEHIV